MPPNPDPDKALDPTQIPGVPGGVPPDPNRALDPTQIPGVPDAVQPAPNRALGPTQILGGPDGTQQGQLLAGQRIGKCHIQRLLGQGGMGAVYLGLQVFHVGHHHESDAVIPQKVAIVTLLLSVTLSPCSLAIPVLVASAGNWTMILVLGIVLLVTTVGNMLLLVGLTSLGIEKLKFACFERHEKWIVGIVLIILGTAILVFHK